MIKVKDIMTKNVITTSQNATIREAARLMVSKSVSSLVVVDKYRPIAVVSEYDIIKGVDSKKTKVRDVMSREYAITSTLTGLSDIIKSLKEEKIKRFAVVEENGKLTGLVTETDIVEAIRDFTRFHQIVQDVILAIFGLATAFFLFYFSPFGKLIFG